jgi:hypothetical protein
MNKTLKNTILIGILGLGFGCSKQEQDVKIELEPIKSKLEGRVIKEEYIPWSSGMLMDKYNILIDTKYGEKFIGVEENPAFYSGLSKRDLNFLINPGDSVEIYLEESIKKEDLKDTYGFRLFAYRIRKK